jgi:hypothetical protein
MQAGLGCAGLFGLVFEFFFICISLANWCEPGRLSVPKSGETLQLTGAPGDTIRLRVPVPGQIDGDYRELSAELRHAAEPADEFLLSLHARLSNQNGDDPDVYGSLIVPELPHGTDLNGRLYGTARFADGKTALLNVRTTLRVLAPGQGEASGSRDMKRHRAKIVLANVGILGVSSGLILQAVFAETRSIRRQARDGPPVT